MPWEPAWSTFTNSKSDWRARHRAWRKAWQRGRGASFLIVRTEDATLVGGIALSDIKGGASSSATLGYWLGAGLTGQGYMTEAVNLVAEWAFGSLGLARIEAGTLLDNTRSQRVLERCLFQREGIARAYLEIAGERRDHVLFARLAGDRPGI